MQGRVTMIVGANSKNGGRELSTFVRSQAESLESAGWIVQFGFVDSRTSVGGIIQNIRRLRTEITHTRPALVHAQYGSVTAAVAHFIRGSLPLIVSFCGDDLLGTPNPGLRYRVREWGARAIGLWAARRAAAIITKSNNLFHALPHILQKKAVVLSNGVETTWFRPMERDECRAKLGWDTKSKVVLFNASQNDNQNVKNLPLARTTVTLLGRSVPNVSLRMMSNANSEQVRLMLNAADCLLMTSLHEGSPNIVKEAMACNLPVVSVPCGDVGERVKETYPGAVRRYDASALADAIEDVFRAGCRSNGREQLVLQELTTSDVAQRLIHIYQDVLARCQQGVLKQTCVA